MPDTSRPEEVGQSAAVHQKLGELIAEVRALKHSSNNNGQKLDSFQRVASSVEHALTKIEEHEKELESHHLRLGVLEADKNRREGAIGLVEWLARHWPFTILVGALIFFSAWFNGKIHP